MCNYILVGESAAASPPSVIRRKAQWHSRRASVGCLWPHRRHQCLFARFPHVQLCETAVDHRLPPDGNGAHSIRSRACSDPKASYCWLPAPHWGGRPRAPPVWAKLNADPGRRTAPHHGPRIPPQRHPASTPMACACGGGPHRRGLRSCGPLGDRKSDQADATIVVILLCIWWAGAAGAQGACSMCSSSSTASAGSGRGTRP